ncbi:MAG: hypothetical protein DCE90_09095 [Pseudanabaena sp.]|nr:MAG: hypothetical protein DCE90_09095 [Pseudanabaena sp.]
MESCRNVLLEYVYKEANAQIEGLGVGIKHKYNLEEVMAYALNRLPPMFASTDFELQVKRQECDKLRDQVFKAVRQSLIAVRRDPLRQPEPLADVELANAPFALRGVREILNSRTLTWFDLPTVIEKELEGAIARYNSGNSKYSSKYGTLGMRQTNAQMYLRKSAPATPVVSELKKKEYEVYMIEANHIVHSLERLVIRMAQTRAQSFPQGELRFIRLEDVLARTLNRLPPLYATSNKGLGHLRQYAQLNIGSELAIIVYESMLETRKANYQRINPLMFYKIRHEREQALINLSKLFSKEIKWQNLEQELGMALELARGGTVCWVRSPVKASPA